MDTPLDRLLRACYRTRGIRRMKDETIERNLNLRFKSEIAAMPAIVEWRRALRKEFVRRLVERAKQKRCYSASVKSM